MNEFRHLYIHLPFCRHKCGYCDFNAYAGMDRLMPDYVEALERELAEAARTRPFARLETVYLGGGTPSLLPPPLMSRLLAFVHRWWISANAKRSKVPSIQRFTFGTRCVYSIRGGCI